jgi:hypothetical protein
MPAIDLYHEHAKKALIRDGWIITHDPYTLTFGQRNVFVDMGAERPIGAEKEGKKIAVEVKSFVGASDIRDLEIAVGQYVFYRSLLKRFEPDRKLYLAIPEIVLTNTLEEPIVRPVVDDLDISLFAFNPEKEEIIKWIP